MSHTRRQTFSDRRYLIGTLALLLTSSSPTHRRAGFCADYEVGPEQKYANIDRVPWEALEPGDRVLIHARSEPYKGKWVVCRRGTAERPITIAGVIGSDGKLPIIDGRSAVTRPALNYWGEERGVVKIGGANVPEDTMPAYVVIENLEIRSGRPPYRFIGRRGITPYAKNAAALYIERGEHITVRHCILSDSGNGLFVSSGSSDILIEGCQIHGNGNPGSMYEHNVYTEARGIVFQFNSLGTLRPRSEGSNLKDRSAGLVVRYNWIEGGNRQLDLVDAEGSDRLRTAPEYRETFVYGNVLVERDGDGNNQIVHYGGDSGTAAAYRKGTLYFYHNTVISQRMGTTVLFRLSTDSERLDCRNNIVYVTALGRNLALLESKGRATLGRNWFKTGWVISHERFQGRVIEVDSNLTGELPGFRDAAHGDLHLTATSPCVDVGSNVPVHLREEHPVLLEYSEDGSGLPRSDDGRHDLGAFEYVRSDSGTR